MRNIFLHCKNILSISTYPIYSNLRILYRPEIEQILDAYILYLILSIIVFNTIGNRQVKLKKYNHIGR